MRPPSWREGGRPTNVRKPAKRLTSARSRWEISWAVLSRVARGVNWTWMRLLFDEPPPPGPSKAELEEVRETQTNNVGELPRADDESAGAVYDPHLAALRGDLIQIRLSRGHRHR